MSDVLVIEIQDVGATDAIKKLDTLQGKVVQLGASLAALKTSTPALDQLKAALGGISGGSKALDEVNASLRGMPAAMDGIKASFGKSISGLGRVLKTELDVLGKQINASTAGMGANIGSNMETAIASGTPRAVQAVRAQGKTIAAAARAEATAVYEAMVAGQANAKIKDFGALFQLQKAGAALSPYHKQVLDNWKTSANIAQQQLSAAVQGDRVKTENLVKSQTALLQNALKQMGETSALRDSSLAGIYSKSLARGNANVSAVRAKLKAEADAVKSAFTQETAALQAALKAMEARSATQAASLAGIYAGSRARGAQDIARVRADLKRDADAIIAAATAEAKRVQSQVSAAMNNASGSYTAYNAKTQSKGREVTIPGATLNGAPRPGEIDSVSAAMKRLTLEGNNAHSMARGLASGFGLLWLTWGKLVPLFTGAGISYGLKKAFDIGSEVEYQIRFMEILGKTTQEQGKIIRAELRAIDQTTQFSLVELSQAMVRMQQAGKTSKEALQMLRPAADLASAGMTDLKTSTDLLLQTQALFGKTSADSAKMAAQIFTITKSSVLRVEDIAGSMRYASEANTRFGKSLEETLTILGALAQAGLKGAVGGTAYINFLRDINGRSGPATAALKELGDVTGKTIKIFDEAGKQRSTIDIFNDIAKAAAQLKNVDADRILGKLMSDRGGRAFFAMLRTGTADLTEMVSTLEKVDPSVLFDAARGLMDTTKGALDILQGSMVGALDKVFDANATQFKTFITDITKAIDSDEFAVALHGMVASVSALYGILKASAPAIQAFGTAWLVFKAASIGVSVFQGTTAALVAMSPVLAMTTGQLHKKAAALTTSTLAWEMNGAAMIGNAAASRAAVVGLDTAGIAAARASAVAGAAAGGMRALSVAIGFLSNPIVGVIATLGLLGAAFWSAKSSADGAVAGMSESIVAGGAVNLTQWNLEIAALRERNALLARPQDAYSGKQSELEASRKTRAARVDDIGKIMDRYEAESKGASPRQQAVIDARYRRVIASATRAAQLAEDTANQAQGALDKARQEDAAAKEKQDAAERARQLRLNPVQGAIAVPAQPKPWGAGKGSKDKNPYEANIVFRNNAVKEIEKANGRELADLEALSNNALKILDARHNAGVISEGAYQAELFSLVTASEAKQLDALNAGAARRQEAMQLEADDLWAAYDKAVAKKDTVKIDEFTQSLQNMGQTAVTYYEAYNDKANKLADDGLTRVKVASINAQGAIKKAQDSSRDFWKQDREEANKLRALDAIAQKYKYASESVLSFDVANREAALAGAAATEKYNSQLASMDIELNTAKSSLVEFDREVAKDTEFKLDSTKVAEARKNLVNVVDELQVLRNAAADNVTIGVNDAALQAFEKARQQQIDSLTNGLSDALSSAVFDGGKEGGKKFMDSLRQEFLRKPFEARIRAIVGDVVGNVMDMVGLGAKGGAGAGAAGGFGNLLSAGSTLYKGGKAAAGWLGLGGSSAATSAVGALGSGTFGMGMSAAPALGATLNGSIMAGAAGTTSVSAAGIAGGGAAGGFGAMAAAAGPWIAAGLALYSIVKKFDNSGTIHAGAGAIYSADKGLKGGADIYTRDTFGMGAKGEYKKEAQANVDGIAKSLGTALDAVAVGFGKRAGYEIATAFADDTSKDGAWGSLRISKEGKDLLNWEDTRKSKWAPKEFSDGDAGYQEYLTAVARDTRKVLLDMDMPSWATAMLNSIGEVSNMEELAGVISQIGEIQTAFVQMGKTIDGFAGMSDNAFGTLMKASGGIDALAAAAGTYYENFYPEAERMGKATASLTAELAKSGVSMPASKEAYRKLVEEQLAAGESGAELAAKLLLLNGSFAQVTDYAEQAAKDAEQAAKDTITSLLDAVGIGAADMGKTFRDVLLGRTDAAEAGAALADSVTGGIYNAIAGGAAQQLTDLMMTSLITPVVQAAVAGTSISEAVSQSAIDSMVQQAQRAAAALGQIFSDPAFQAAIASVGAAITGVVSAAGAGIKPYAPAVVAANSTASDSYAQETSEPLKNAWEDLIATIVRSTQDAVRELSRLGMTSYESALASIQDKAQEQVRSLQDAGYMRAEREAREVAREVRDTSTQALDWRRGQGLAEDGATITKIKGHIEWAAGEFDRLSAALAKLPPEVQAMVDAETALLNARNALTAQGTLDGLGKEVAQLGISAVAKQFQDLDSKAADYVKGLVDLGQATDANIAGVTSWADAMREQIRSSAYDSLLSPDELRTRGTAKLATDFSALGSSVPASTAALRGMIDAARDLGNLTLADSLLELVPGFLALQTAVEGAGSAIDNSGQADKLLAQLGKEMGYLGLSDIEKEIAGIAERGNEYRKTLADLGQGTDANIKAVNSWQNAMMESALAAQAAADIAAAAQGVQAKFAARNGAGALKDRLQEAMGSKGTFAAQREGELWTALAKTTDYEKQIDLASQLTDMVMARQQLEVQNAERLLDFGKGLRSYVDSLKIGTLSPLTNAQKLAEAARQYQDTLGKAQGGDTTAQGNLQGIASSYLDLARTYYAGNEQFAGIFSSVTQALDALGSSSMTEAQQQLAVGTQSLSELQKLYGITSTAYTALNGQYETAVTQLAKMQDALVLQTDSLDQLKVLATTMAGLPAEIAVRMPVIDTSAADAKAEKAASDLLDELRRLREEVAQLRQESRQDAQMQAGVTAASADASAERIAQASAQAVRANTVQQGATLI